MRRFASRLRIASIKNVSVLRALPTTRTWIAFRCLSSSSSSSSSSSGRGRKVDSFSVDRTGLLGSQKDVLRSLSEEVAAMPAEDEAEEAILNMSGKEIASPLAKELRSYVKMKGPITVHDYMSQASNHVIHGYYQHAEEKIGRGGDFITAPEMSQLFGEMVGLWCISMWQSMGSPSKINLVELGPGKGTLIKDVLSVAARFPAFASAISVHLVELSETMRGMQRQALECSTDEVAEKDALYGIVKMRSAIGNIPVCWYHLLQHVSTSAPKDPCLILGQEFLDAYPVHQFVYTKTGWKEKLVDIDDTPDSPFHFRFVLSPTTTPAAKTLLGLGRPQDETSAQAQQASEQLKEGDGLEISPLSLATCEDIAKLVCSNGGAALLIDYGENFAQEDSLRGFKKHLQVNVLSEPGIADITADVDFMACSKSAIRKGAQTRITTQGQFLMRMGIVQRVERLIDLPSTSEEQAAHLVDSLRKFVQEEHMGKRFKCMAITDPKKLQLQHVPGFD